MAICPQPPMRPLVSLARYLHFTLQHSFLLMARSIHTSTARTMLNSGDPVDISVWLSACRFRSIAEKEIRRLDSRTPKLYISAIQLLRRLEECKNTFLRLMSHHRFSALLAKKSATAASSG